MRKGKTAVIPWPEVMIGRVDVFEGDQRFGQRTVDDWGAARRAFLSSCIKDRQWMEEDDAEADTFYGDIQQSDRRLV